MPIYEYDCSACGVVEAIQRFSDPSLEYCPQCADKGVSSAVTRRLSVSSFHLKGGGWYKTDYAAGGRSGGASATTGSGAKGSDSAGASTESASSSSAGESSSGTSGSSSSGGGCGSSCGCH